MPAGPSQRTRVICKDCGSENIRFRRYKCLRCLNYDLCGQCHDSGKASDPRLAEPHHTSFHPFQRVLTAEEKEIYLQSGVTDPEPLNSFSCPCCLHTGMGKLDLLDHLADDHFRIEGEFLCPICVSAYERDAHYVPDDLLSHLFVDHCRDSFGDNESGSASASNAAASSSGVSSMAQSGRRAGGGSQQQQRSVSTNTGDSYAQDASNVAANILAQYRELVSAQSAANVRLSMDAIRINNNTNNPGLDATEADVASLSLYSDMESLADDDNEDDASTDSAGAGNEEFAAASAAPALVCQLSLEKTIEDDRNLLQSVFKAKLAEEEKIAIDVERANRSLFLQELICSPLTENINGNNQKKPSTSGARKKSTNTTTNNSSVKKKRNIFRTAAVAVAGGIGEEARQSSSEANELSSVADRGNRNKNRAVGGKCVTAKSTHQQHDDLSSTNFAQRAASVTADEEGSPDGAAGGGDGPKTLTANTRPNKL